MKLHLPDPCGDGAATNRRTQTQWEADQPVACADWCEGLERAGLEQERRVLRVWMEEMCWNREDDGSLRLEFSLNAGAYATVLVRELVEGVP